MRVTRTLTPLLVAAIASVTGWASAQGPADADPEPSEGDVTALPPATSPAQIAQLYRDLRFDACIQSAQQLLDPDNPNRPTETLDIDRTTRYLGGCLVRQGRTEEAQELFFEWIRDRWETQKEIPARPYPGIFPPAVLKAYDLAAAQVEELKVQQMENRQAQIRWERNVRDWLILAERRRQEELLQEASKETVVERNRRWIATIPFGVGQFQNGKNGLGWFFLTTQALALGVTAGGMATEIHLGNLENSDRDRNLLQRRRARGVWVAGMYSFSTLVGLGILEAHLNFVPSSKFVRERPVRKWLREPIEIPPPPSAAVRPIDVPGGLGLGFVGSF